MNKRILNLGCGNDTYGTDFVDLYPKRKEVKKVDFDNEDLPYRNSTFDEIYSSFVFEHLKNPFHTLQEIYRVLKKGGRVRLYTDNAGFLGFHTKKTFWWKVHNGDYNSLGGYGEKDQHFALFTPSHIESHFIEAGFQKVKVNLLLHPRHKLSSKTELIHKLLKRTRFNAMAYPNIYAEAIK